MKNIIFILVLIAIACSNQKAQNNDTVSFAIENSHKKLSEVIFPLLDKEVSGYVVISKYELEYSNIEMAREDVSEPKSIVKFDVERFDYHTPESEGDNSGAR